MTSHLIYKGDLICDLTHSKSKQNFITDAPTDNNGKGSAFSPTDLTATSLAACIMTVMGIWAKNNDVHLDGTSAEIQKIMSDNPRRISEINITFQMPKREFNAKQKNILEKIAETCPVSKSLHPDILQNVTFIW